jgi:formylmethanofuran dehydrogenase subunit B
MKSCRYGALLFGMGLTMNRGRHFNSGALLALATDLNAFTHWVAKPVRGHGNVTGADNVVSWQTGFPFGVNFSRGYPRFNPGEFTTVDLLSRGDVDAALIIASDPASNFPKAAIEHLKRIPVISLDPKLTHTSQLARVAFTTATYGISVPGTVYRMDDVPITLRPAFDSPYPSDEQVLTAVRHRVRALLGGNRPVPGTPAVASAS